MGTKYFISADSLKDLNAFLRKAQYSSIFVLVDENTQKLSYPFLEDNIPIISKDLIIEIPSGERFKNLSVCTRIWKKLIEKNADRKSVLINLGGGTITDIGGFAASTFKRGIDYINIPTTLLAIIDAAIGGKTGINFMNYKNQVGSFAEPIVVAVHLGFMDTLDDVQLKSGFGEIIKYALIRDVKHWNEIIAADLFIYKHTYESISRCIEIKKEYIFKDPKEKNIRKILNFGHTIGHSLETFYFEKKKNRLSHGEAVAIGIIIESIISREILNLSQQELDSIIDFIIRNYSKPSFSKNDIDTLLMIMVKDKKNINSLINFTLLKKIGNARIDNYVPKEVIRSALIEYLEL